VTDVILVTGAGGLVGSAVSRRLKKEGYTVTGIDNDMRGSIFGREGSVRESISQLQAEGIEVRDIDLRNERTVFPLFSEYGREIKAIVHTAGQPSHDWSKEAPLVDFDLNARVTLALLEATRNFCPEATFVFTSTNKVYGDLVNSLQFTEFDTRYDIPPVTWLYHGIPEIMSIDRSMHSLFGVSKVAADLAVQEYGRLFGMNTVTFRCGCITGGGHKGVCLHGFLSYLIKCVMTGTEYRVFGYKGKQVRDNIHANDLADAMLEFIKDPRPAAVYNMGGGRENSISVLEALRFAERLTGKRAKYVIERTARQGDHIWWISNTSAFRRDYPDWDIVWSLDDIFEDIISRGKSC